MFCSNCGAQIPEGAKFCTKCGTKVVQQETTTQTPSRASAVVPPTDDMDVRTSAVISSNDEESAQDKFKNLKQKFGSKVTQVTDSISSKIPENATAEIGAKFDTLKSSVSDKVVHKKQDQAYTVPTSNVAGQEPSSQIYSSEIVDQGVTLSSQESYQAKEKTTVQKFGDKITDTVSSALGGKKIETVRISMEDMIDLIKKHYIDLASTEEEYEAIQKTVNGNMLLMKQLDSKDGNYHISVSVGNSIDILNPDDVNWIRVNERGTGKIYQYSALKWGDFKKAVAVVIEQAKA